MTDFDNLDLEVQMWQQRHPHNATPEKDKKIEPIKKGSKRWKEAEKVINKLELKNSRLLTKARERKNGKI